MNEILKTNDCERGAELVAYFYGEASAAERESFDAHLARCGACRDELAAFAGVREAVGHWRSEILNSAPALSLANPVASPTPQEVRREQVAPTLRRRSARAAFSEFFTLSPLWLRAGLAAATLVLCALAALALVNADVRWDDGGLAFNTRLRVESQKAAPPTPEVVAPAGKVYAQAELDNLVAERDAALRELEDTRSQLDDSRAANLIAAVGTLEPASASKTISTPNSTRRERRNAPNARQRNFRDERDEEDVPRLYDLLREAN